VRCFVSIHVEAMLILSTKCAVQATINIDVEARYGFLLLMILWRSREARCRKWKVVRKDSLVVNFRQTSNQVIRQWSMVNGLLFHMTQPTNKRTTRSHCTEQTNHNSEHESKWKCNDAMVDQCTV